jgi:hypothetical protein
MSEADDAYKEAERRIAEAQRTGAESLNFDLPETRALARLPPGIGALAQLHVLHLSRTKITDLAPLAGMTGMMWLSLDYTLVADLAPLAGMTEIKSLWLSSTKVTDISPLAGLVGLNTLSLSNSPVIDFAPLAGMTEIKVLSLGNTQVTDLTPLAGMTGIIALWLANTQVTELEPLAGMTKIKTLSLLNSSALDLRPLCGLRGLVEAPGNRGLTFKGTSAARADPRIAEIAEIADPATRAQTLFDYLETWVPPLPAAPPEPDPFLPVIIDGGRLDVAASLPDADEQAEPLKRALHARLQPKADDLAQAAGNRFPRLARLARTLQADLERPFEAVDLLNVHLGIEDLAQRAALGQEDGEPFPPEVTAPLADVARIGPGLTLDHDEVTRYEDRKRRYRAQPEPEKDRAAHAALGQAIAAGDPAIGERLRSVEPRVEGLPDEVVSAVRTALHRNLLHRIGVGALVIGATFGGNVAAGIAANAYGPAILAFVQSNWALLVDVLATYGPGFFDWFIAAVAPTPELRAQLPRVDLARARKRDQP